MPFFFASRRELLFSLLGLCDDLLTLVETTSLAHTVCKDRLAALGALYDVGGGLKLPNAGTSLHLSRMRNFSLWYCHVDYLLLEHAARHSRICVFLFFIFVFHFVEYLLKGHKARINFLSLAGAPAFIQILTAT